jgi:hypothetical protein
MKKMMMILSVLLLSTTFLMAAEAINDNFAVTANVPQRATFSIADDAFDVAVTVGSVATTYTFTGNYLVDIKATSVNNGVLKIDSYVDEENTPSIPYTLAMELQENGTPTELTLGTLYNLVPNLGNSGRYNLNEAINVTWADGSDEYTYLAGAYSDTITIDVVTRN